MIYWHYECLTHFSLEIPERVLANNADPDQMPQNAASDQHVHCLQSVKPFSLSISKSYNLIYVKFDSSLVYSVEESIQSKMG